MSVHYKFKSAVEYDTLPVDGLNISLGDLKDAIIQQKRLGKGQPYDLQITNAETKEVYTDDKVLIPKNSSLIVARIPLDPSQMKRPWESKDATALILSNPSNLMNTEDAAEAAEIDRKIREVTDLTLMKGSEQDKINAMVAQSTMDYHPSKYVKLRASKMGGVVPTNYKCYKCNKGGHWVTMCPLNNQDLRKSTGIPSMFLEETDDPNAPGVMITQSGKLVKLRDMGGETIQPGQPPTERNSPPEELKCQLCKEILKDAVLIPCCVEAFCDECIRNHLLDSEDHVCPSCGKDSIGPDTLIPNRYLRIKVQEFECGWFPTTEKKTDASSDGGEALSPIPTRILSRVSPTPPHSPSHVISSPARIRVSDKLLQSPSSQPPSSPLAERSPFRGNVVEAVSNGDLPPQSLIPVATEEKVSEIRDVSGDFEGLQEPLEDNDEMVAPSAVEEKENVELKDCDTSVDEKQKKIKKKKAKKKKYESEEEKEEKKRKKKEKSHKSQDKKSSSSEKKSKSHSSSNMLKDVADLPQDRLDQWDDADIVKKSPHDSEDDDRRRRRTPPRRSEAARDRDMLDDEGPPGDDWKERKKDSIRAHSRSRSRSRSRTRSRSKSGDKAKDKVALFDNVVPFNPHVPPPNFVKKSPPQGYQYPVTTTYVPQVPPRVTTDTSFPHYQPGVPPPIFSNRSSNYTRTHSFYSERELIADPLTEFERHMREKDERNRKWRYSRSRSPSRSPRYRRVRSRSRQRSWSRSRSRSTSRSRLGPVARSPRSQSRRRWSRSPLSRGHNYRSRSPSYTRERSISNRSISLSRSPSPSRRTCSSPLRVPPPHVHPDPHNLSRPPPTNYGVQGDYNRYPMAPVPHDQFYQPPPHHAPTMHPGQGPWDQPPPSFNPGMPDNMRSNYRGRRGHRGYRGHNFNHRGHDYRPHRMMDDRRGMQGPGGWERDGRQNFNTELPRTDRNTRHYDGDRRRFGEGNDYDEGRNRRFDAPSSFSDEEWRYSDDRKREDPEKRRYEGRRGLDDRKDDTDVRKGSDEDYDDYKRSRKDGDRGRSYDRSYRDAEEGRSTRLDRDGKFRDVSRRDSPRDDDLLYPKKSYDSPGKSHKVTSPKDRKERDPDRRDRDYDKRDFDGDKRDRDGASWRDRDSERRDRSRSAYRKERDDRRDRDTDKPESERKEKGYERKESSSYKKDKDHDKKHHDKDRKNKEGDRREQDSGKHERESSNRDRGDKSGEEERRERKYVSRWDHNETKGKLEKGTESDRKSHESESVNSQEEKEHKRKSKRKEGKDESHQGKEKEGVHDDSEVTSKGEKKKHDKKKKKKEKRRASQASTEASQGEMSGDEVEDKKKKKKREKKRKLKGVVAEGTEGGIVKTAEDEKPSEVDPKDSGNGEMSESYAEHESEMALQESTPEPKPGMESPRAQLSLPPLSKWERDEELTLTPKVLPENNAPEEEEKVTVDILKRAENTIFSGRGLAPRKVFLDSQKQKEGEEKERSPTPEWDKLEMREAKRRGPSIQITISSKTESQIGRPRGGRYQPSSPEHTDDKRYSLRSRKGSETENKSDKHVRSQKRSQSPSESTSGVKTRRKSEKEQAKEEKEKEQTKEEKEQGKEEKAADNGKDKSNGSESIPSDENVRDTSDVKSSEEKETEKGASLESLPESQMKPESDGTKLKQTESLQHDTPEPVSNAVKEEDRSPQGVKRPSSSADELELHVKKAKVEGVLSIKSSDETENASGAGVNVTNKNDGNETNDAKESFDSKEPSVLQNNGREVKTLNPVVHSNAMNSNLVTIPLISRASPAELEDGEISSEDEKEDHKELVPVKAYMGAPAMESSGPFLESQKAYSSEDPQRRYSGEEPQKRYSTEEPQTHKRYLTEEPQKGYLADEPSRRYSPIRVPSPAQVSEAKEMKVKEKSKKRKKRKRSSSSSSSNSSSSSSSSSSDEEEITKKKKKKKKKKKAAVLSESSDGESQRKHKKKKKEKKKKKKKSKKKSDK